VAAFVTQLLAINPNANIVVSGDLNDFQFSDTLAPLAAAGLVNLTNTLPENERYTYSFEGNLQALDHMWVSSNLLNAGALYDVVHANSEFATQVSDHDPLLMTLGLVPAPVPEPATWLMMALGMAGLVMRARRR
jgi:predicted extracellular nuclease